MTDGRIKRNGNFQKNPYFQGELSDNGYVIQPAHPEEIEGEEDQFVNPEHFGAPFVVTHNKGSVRNDFPCFSWKLNFAFRKFSVISKFIFCICLLKFTGIEIDAEEPLWVVNYKKSVASQMQMDLTGVRRDGTFNYESVPAEEETKTFTVFEVFVKHIFMVIKIPSDIKIIHHEGFHYW